MSFYKTCMLSGAQEVVDGGINGGAREQIFKNGGQTLRQYCQFKQLSIGRW